MKKVNDSQLPLNFKTTQIKSFNDFIVDRNGSVISNLQSFIKSDQSLFYLWGSQASGKSHVLQALINTLVSNDRKAVILTPNDLSKRENISLIELFDFICIDDIENIAGNTFLEEALFTWINEIKQKHKKIILAGKLSSNDKQWQLPDLRSRIQAGQTHEIFALNRDDSFKIFTNQANSRGLNLDEKTMNYLQKNTSSNLSYLSQLLDKIDQVTLAQKKQVTIPLLKKILLEKS